MAFLIFRLAHSFSHLHALFKPARALTEERRDSVSLGAFLPCSRLSFQQTPKKRLQAKPKTPVIQGIPSGTQRATVQAWHLRENERDLKNRKRFGSTEDDDTTYWPNTAGAYRRIESANKGRRGERYARLERSESGRLGCSSLPRNLSNRRHLPRPLLPLHKQLDRQRAVQRSIKFAENSTRKVLFFERACGFHFRNMNLFDQENQRVNEIFQIF